MIDGQEPAAARNRLRILIISDATLAGLAGIFTVAMAATVARISSLLWLGVFVIAISVLIASALRPLRRDDVFLAVLRFSVANWVVSVVAAAVATFSWPLMMQVTILPGILAASYVSRRQLGFFASASFATALLVVCLGLLQDITGLSDEVPTWLKTAILVGTAPAFGAIVILVVLQHHAMLSRALDFERAASQQLAEHAEELRRSRERVVAATDRERRRIERDLHDGAQARLVGINLKLASARRLARDDPTAAENALVDVRDEVHRAHAELRELAHGIYPAALTQHGLVAAIEAAADGSPAPVRLALDRIGRLPGAVEATIYFCVLEALQNAIRHSQADLIQVRLSRSASEVRFDVIDDGVGTTDDGTDGGGITNMRDRLGAIGGELQVTSANRQGTQVTGVVPLQP
jgi:signal transduction histidine kinase